MINFILCILLKYVYFLFSLLYFIIIKNTSLCFYIALKMVLALKFFLIFQFGSSQNSLFFNYKLTSKATSCLNLEKTQSLDIFQCFFFQCKALMSITKSWMTVIKIFSSIEKLVMIDSMKGILEIKSFFFTKCILLKT